MKRVFILSVTLLLLFSLVSSVFADSKRISVYVNEEEIVFEGHAPFIEKGTTLVPVRPLFEMLNLEIYWEEEANSVIGSGEGFAIELQVGSDEANVNGDIKSLGATPRIINGTTYVPARFISEEAGYEVTWNGSTQTVTIFSPSIGENDIDEEVEEGSRGFLWKVQNEENTVYLLGTINAASSEMYPLHSSIVEAFASSDYLVVEFDPTNLDFLEDYDFDEFDFDEFDFDDYDFDEFDFDEFDFDDFDFDDFDFDEFEFNEFDDDEFGFEDFDGFDLLESLGMGLIDIDNIFYLDDSTLQDYISPEAYEQLDDILKEHDMSAQFFDMFKPGVVALIIQLLQLENEGYEAWNDIELHFIVNASELDLPILELQSSNSPFGVLDQMSPELQVLLLQQTMDEYAEFGSKINDLIEIWNNGDDGMLLALEAEAASNEELNKIILGDRNIQISDKLEAYLNNSTPSTYFVIIESTHILGEAGIIELLEEKGYTIIRQ